MGNDVTHRFPALIAAPAPARERLWLTGARLFDGTGAALRENTAILVEDGRFYGDMYREADGPDDIRRAVREQIRAGADFVKVMTTGARSNELEDPEPPQLTEPELGAVTDEARRLGYRVAAHAEDLDGCAAAIRHGVDTIEHGMYLHQRPGLSRLVT